MRTVYHESILILLAWSDHVLSLYARNTCRSTANFILNRLRSGNDRTGADTRAGTFRGSTSSDALEEVGNDSRPRSSSIGLYAEIAHGNGRHTRVGVSREPVGENLYDQIPVVYAVLVHDNQQRRPHENDYVYTCVGPSQGSIRSNALEEVGRDSGQMSSSRSSSAEIALDNQKNSPDDDVHPRVGLSQGSMSSNALEEVGKDSGQMPSSRSLFAEIAQYNQQTCSDDDVDTRVGVFQGSIGSLALKELESDDEYAKVLLRSPFSDVVADDNQEK